MSQLFRDTALSLPASSGELMGLLTLAFMAMFLAWAWYAYAPSRRALMDEYANLPLERD